MGRQNRACAIQTGHKLQRKLSPTQFTPLTKPEEEKRSKVEPAAQNERTSPDACYARLALLRICGSLEQFVENAFVSVHAHGASSSTDLVRSFWLITID